MRRMSVAVGVAVAVLTLSATALTELPAHAAPQPLFGTTVDVVASSSANSLLGQTAYLPLAGGFLVASLASTLGSDVEVSVIDGPATLRTCTIGSGNLGCALATAGLFSAGATPVTMRFTMDATSVDFTGTVFAVTHTTPSVRIEWQDASGAWVDGSGTNLPFLGDIALRCVVTNNSNAPLTFGSFVASVSYSGGPDVVPLEGILAAGETKSYALWSGPASLTPSVSCGGGIDFSDGIGGGNGTGGGVISIGGTITVEPHPAPGATVAVTGAGLFPTVVTRYTVLLDDVEVAESPVTTTGPDFDFSLDVAIPESLAPGAHAITVQVTFASRDIAFAYFAFEVPQPAEVSPPELADTGQLQSCRPSLPGCL